MKLIDITHFYNSKSGGVKKYLEEKVRYFKEKDIEHSLILPSENNDIITKEKAKYFFIKSPEIPFFKPYRIIINKKAIFDIIKQEKPQIVEVGSPYFIPVWINENKKLLCYKTVGFFHSNIEGSIETILKKINKPFLKVAKSLIKKEYSDFDIVISPSKYIENYLNSLGILNTKTVYLGIDTKIFQFREKNESILDRYNLPKDKILVVYAGRLSSDKNVLEIASIYNILTYFRPNKYHLVIVGSGHLENKFLKKIEGNYTHIGYIQDKNQYADILSVCDIFITTSKIETFGLAIVEAQALGLPVVAYKTTSIPEVVYYKELLAEDIDNFIKNIELASEYYISQSKRKLLSENIKKYFSWEKTFGNMEKIYQDLIK